MLNTLIIRAAAGCTVIIGGTLFAMESGWIAQSGPAQAADQAANGQSLISSSQPTGSMGPALPVIEENNVIVPLAEQSLAVEATIVPTSFNGPATTPAAPATGPTDDVGGVSPLGLPCGINTTATAMPAAMVALDVTAPCRANAAVTITHSGLQIETSTDAVGLLTLDIPAFETPAFFSVTFADGVEEAVLVSLPDLQDYDRIGLNWQGDMGLELHAMEFGAAFGDAGHIWQDTPAGPEVAIAGDGGFLSVVETGDSFAQIYTLPRATLREGEQVRLSIDAPVTLANCTRDVLARTLRTEAAGPVDVTELTFTAPPCDAVGDVLVLQNLLDDLRLASN
ncbi:hypothetical protein [Jannaschia sp. CCS1]|uniref:hypothetical protein n=1 Tax=Jannaschia sp. (strain CCS1) TaxID=290400 RepID=UPI000053BFE6|nr:hypothetical protein [Jannaschia sp. CCS1]ABD53205.1 hypothetical protein Jann_0288 [Jannaschia sp. CCS1]